MPSSVGLRELRHHAREVIESARKEGRVAITDRGEIIGYVVAPDPPPTGRRRAMNPQIEALLQRLDATEPYDSGLAAFVRTSRADAIEAEFGPADAG